MSRFTRHWKLLLPLGVLVILASVVVSTSFAASKAKVVKIAIMTDCKGAFGFGYEPDIGGAQAALANYAHGKVMNPKKPSAGMTGHQGRDHASEDRRLRLRRRHGPDRGQGDAAADGAARCGRDDRPAVR